MKKTSLGLIALTPSYILKVNSINKAVLVEFDKLDKIHNATAKETVSKLLDTGDNWWEVKVIFDWKKNKPTGKNVGDLEVIVRWERVKNKTYYKILSVKSGMSND